MYGCVGRYYETALQQLILMQSRAQLTKLARDLKMPDSESEGGNLRGQHLPGGWADQVAEAAALLMAREKYSYVVSRYCTACGHRVGLPVVAELHCM
jgi:hypothetical protein